MQGIIPEMLPQIITGVIVSLCAIFATWAVNKASKKLDNIATKDYVKNQLDEQTRKMGEMFVRAAEQAEVNAVIEQRMKYLEDQIWQRFERMVEMIRPKSMEKV